MIPNNLKVSQRGFNDLNCLPIVPNDPKWSEMVLGGSKWSKLVLNISHWSQSVPNYPRRFQMVSNILKRLNLLQVVASWYAMRPCFTYAFFAQIFRDPCKESSILCLSWRGVCGRDQRTMGPVDECSLSILPGDLCVTEGFPGHLCLCMSLIFYYWSWYRILTLEGVVTDNRYVPLWQLMLVPPYERALRFWKIVIWRANLL